MNERNRHRSLRLRRQTLRVLSATSLARAAGGAGGLTRSIVEPAPKTNAWTSGDGGDVERLCSAVAA